MIYTVFPNDDTPVMDFPNYVEAEKYGCEYCENGYVIAAKDGEIV